MARRVRVKNQLLDLDAEPGLHLGPAWPVTGEQERGGRILAQDRAPDRDVLIEQIHRLRHQGKVEVDAVLDFMCREKKVNAPFVPGAEVDEVAIYLDRGEVLNPYRGIEQQLVAIAVWISLASR
jgi:hypothetical protein